MVGTRVRAKFRRRTTRRLGGHRPRQNKQTRKYLVDDMDKKLWLLFGPPC